MARCGGGLSWSVEVVDAWAGRVSWRLELVG